MLLLTTTTLGLPGAAPNSKNSRLPTPNELLPRGAALYQQSSLNRAPASTSTTSSLTELASKPCVSIVSNVRDGWCERNCRAGNCPSATCKCDGTPSASAVKPTDHPFGSDATASTKSLHKPAPDSFIAPQLPEEAVGFYMKAWSCMGSEEGNLGIWDCAGPAEKKNLNVFFSGAGSLEKALKASLDVFPGSGDGACKPGDEHYCNRQVDEMIPYSAKTREEAIPKILEGWNGARCKSCLGSELKKAAPTEQELAAKRQPYPPFSTELGLRQGVQFVSIGGADGAGTLSAAKLQSIWQGGAEAARDAGYHGVCFDVESTTGEEDLVQAFERAFAAVKKAGLLVLVTTSHSAPYAASSEKAKDLIVKSWLKSKNIDIFSPQLYTTGTETAPDFNQAHCSIGIPQHLRMKNTTRLFDERKRAAREKAHAEKERLQHERATSPEGGYPTGCTWKRLKPMRARWIPSISSEDHYPAVKEYFAQLGIQTHGYIQWGANKP